MTFPPSLVPSEVEGRPHSAPPTKRPHVVAIDYGSKHNIFRNLARVDPLAPSPEPLRDAFYDDDKFAGIRQEDASFGALPDFPGLARQVMAVVESSGIRPSCGLGTLRMRLGRRDRPPRALARAPS